MTQITERFNSRTVSQDAAGKKTGTRLFYTLTTSAIEARALFFETVTWQQHPDDGSLVFDRLTVAPTDNGAALNLIAEYSSFRASRFSAYTPQNPGDPVRVGWGKREVTVKIPVSVKSRVAMPGADGDVITDVWTPREMEIVETRPLRIVRVSVGVADIGRLDSITAQTNRVHHIFGARMRFIGGDVLDPFADPVSITYTWEHDAGTYMPAGDNADNRWVPLTPGYGLPDGRTLLRLPYNEVVVIPPTDPREDPGYGAWVQPYPDDPNGWRTLPGLEGA